MFREGSSRTGLDSGRSPMPSGQLPSDRVARWKAAEPLGQQSAYHGERADRGRLEAGSGGGIGRPYRGSMRDMAENGEIQAKGRGNSGTDYRH